MVSKELANQRRYLVLFFSLVLTRCFFRTTELTYILQSGISSFSETALLFYHTEGRGEAPGVLYMIPACGQTHRRRLEMHTLAYLRASRTLVVLGTALTNIRASRKLREYGGAARRGLLRLSCPSYPRLSRSILSIASGKKKKDIAITLLVVYSLLGSD